MRHVYIGRDFSGRDFSGRDLRDSYLRDCTLDDCNFTGADLRHSVLFRCSAKRVNLTDALVDELLQKGTDFEGATFPTDAPPDGVEMVSEILRAYALTLPAGKKRTAVTKLIAYLNRTPYHTHIWGDAVPYFRSHLDYLDEAKQMARDCFGPYPRIMAVLVAQFKRLTS